MTFQEQRKTILVSYFFLVKNMDAHALQMSRLDKPENRSRWDLTKFGLNKGRGVKVTVVCCCAASVHLEKQPYMTQSSGGSLE